MHCTYISDPFSLSGGDWMGREYQAWRLGKST